MFRESVMLRDAGLVDARVYVFSLTRWCGRHPAERVSGDRRRQPGGRREPVGDRGGERA